MTCSTVFSPVTTAVMSSYAWGVSGISEMAMVAATWEIWYSCFGVSGLLDMIRILSLYFDTFSVHYNTVTGCGVVSIVIYFEKKNPPDAVGGRGRFLKCVKKNDSLPDWFSCYFCGIDVQSFLSFSCSMVLSIL